MTKPFDPTKPVQLRDGTPARIIATDIKNSNYPIVAVCTSENGEEYCETFTSEGKLLHGGTKDDLDLVNVPAKVISTVYTSIYYDGTTSISRESLDSLKEANILSIKNVLGIIKTEVYSDGSFTVEKVNA